MAAAAVARFVARGNRDRRGLGNRSLVYLRVATSHLLDVAAGLRKAVDLAGLAGAVTHSAIAGSDHASDRESRIAELANAVGVADG